MCKPRWTLTAKAAFLAALVICTTAWAQSPVARPPVKRPTKPGLDAVDTFFEKMPIPRIRLVIAPPEMDELRKSPRAYVKCSFVELTPGLPDKVLKDVAVHIKGSAGSLRAFDDRPALTVSIDRHSPGRNWHGLEKMHLNNSVQDGTLLSELIGGQVMREAGVPAARSGHARLWINDRDMGMYVLKEGFDDVFLQRFFDDTHGPLYDGGFLRDVDQELSVMSNKSKKNYDRLKQLVAASNDPDLSSRRAKFDKILDVDRFMSLMALEAMTAHWDGYVFNRNNYRVYDDPKSGKFVFIPHGMDQLFQQPQHPMFGGVAIVSRALSDTMGARDAVYDKMESLRKTVFTQQKFDGWIDAATMRLAQAVKEQGDEAMKNHVDRAREMKARVAERLKFIDSQLAARPKPLKFDRSGLVVLEGWTLQVAAGEAKLEEGVEAGRKVLRIRANGAVSASIRRPVILSPGKYALIGQCRAVNVKADAGDNTGVGLRLSGGKRTQRVVGNSTWTLQTFEFEITELGEVVLVGELMGQGGDAMFDAGSLKLKKR